MDVKTWFLDLKVWKVAAVVLIIMLGTEEMFISYIFGFMYRVEDAFVRIFADDDADLKQMHTDYLAQEKQSKAMIAAENAELKNPL